MLFMHRSEDLDFVNTICVGDMEFCLFYHKNLNGFSLIKYSLHNEGKPMKEKQKNAFNSNSLGATRAIRAHSINFSGSLTKLIYYVEREFNFFCSSSEDKYKFVARAIVQSVLSGVMPNIK